MYIVSYERLKIIYKKEENNKDVTMERIIEKPNL